MCDRWLRDRGQIAERVNHQSDPEIPESRFIVYAMHVCILCFSDGRQRATSTGCDCAVTPAWVFRGNVVTHMGWNDDSHSIIPSHVIRRTHPQCISFDVHVRLQISRRQLIPF
jgi:hypothetical protein